MNTEYEVLEDNGRSMKIKTLCTGREFGLRMPRFGMRDEIQSVILNVQKRGKVVRKVVEQISRKRKISEEDVYDMIKDGKLSKEEEEQVNEATKDSEIPPEYLEKIISFVLVVPEGTDIIEYIKGLDIDEGVSICSCAMKFLPNCLSVESKERKK